MPPARSEWPPEVLDAVEPLSCGDVVASPPYFYFADPQYAVLEWTKLPEGADYQGPEVIDAGAYAAPYGVITTQTCDLGEVDFPRPTRPFVGISPVFEGSDLDGSTRKLLQGGKRIGPLLHLPGLDAALGFGFWVADFRVELPVEKSWLVGRETFPSFVTEAGARIIPDVINDIRSRPAWSEVVTEEVQRAILEELKALKAEQRDLFEAVCLEIDEIGGRTDSMLKPSWAQLSAFSQAALSDDVMAWWLGVSASLEEALQGRGVETQPAQAMTFTETSVSTYRQYAPVSLTRYSPL